MSVIDENNCTNCLLVTISSAPTESSPTDGNISLSTSDPRGVNTAAASLYMGIVTPVTIYGIISNLAFIITVHRSRGLSRRKPYWFLYSLAVSDLVLLVTGPLHRVANLLSILLGGGPLFDDVTALCYLNEYIKIVAQDAHAITLLLLAINRFVATIVFTKQFKMFNGIRTSIVITICWVCPSVWNLLPYFSEIGLGPVSYSPSDFTCLGAVFVFLVKDLVRNMICLPAIFLLYVLTLCGFRFTKMKVDDISKNEISVNARPKRSKVIVTHHYPSGEGQNSLATVHPVNTINKMNRIQECRVITVQFLIVALIYIIFLGLETNHNILRLLSTSNKKLWLSTSILHYYLLFYSVIKPTIYNASSTQLRLGTYRTLRQCLSLNTANN